MSLRLKYHWPSIYKDVHKYCSTCDRCQRAKINSDSKPVPLHPLPVADIFGRWSIDVLGPIHTSRQGYKYILVAIETLSRWPEAFPMKTQEATEIADIMFREIFCRHGSPVSLLSDRGCKFLVTNRHSTLQTL